VQTAPHCTLLYSARRDANGCRSPVVMSVCVSRGVLIQFLEGDQVSQTLDTPKREERRGEWKMKVGERRGGVEVKGGGEF
jgi:hypothetical protein